MANLSFDFSDTTIIVTGASSGIGRETAIRFGVAGGTVLVADTRERPKNPEQSRSTADVITDRNGRAHYYDIDVSSKDQVAELIEEARTFGGVDIMINNAGLPSRSSLLDATMAELDTLVDVNVAGVIFGCKHAAADMIDRDDPGAIINTASIAATHSQRNHVLYDATKGAVKMVTRSSALELADHGIRVNAVAPGIIATSFTEGGPTQYRQQVAENKLIKPVPAGRAGEPSDVANAILFLASSEADYVTGELLYVDGGWQIF